MAKATPDDYEAVRTVVATLEPFGANDQSEFCVGQGRNLGWLPLRLVG